MDEKKSILNKKDFFVISIHEFRMCFCIKILYIYIYIYIYIKFKRCPGDKALKLN